MNRTTQFQVTARQLRAAADAMGIMDTVTVITSSRAVLDAILTQKSADEAATCGRHGCIRVDCAACRDGCAPPTAASCPSPSAPCTCTNGIGCVNTPADQW